MDIFWLILGLLLILGGANALTDGASALARRWGVSDLVIGLTVSVAAALKGKTGIAVGNVIGSNIFNIFLVLGLTATVTPLPFGGIGETDLLVMTGASILFWFFGWRFGERVINRWEGGFLVVCYVAYVAWQLVAL